MKISPLVLEALNQVLTLQLTAINQYFLSAKMHKHRGFVRLERRLYQQSLHAMRAAEAVIERVLFLEGLPNLQRLGKISVAESAAEQLTADLKLQTELCAALESLCALSTTELDNGTFALIDPMLSRDQQFIEWLEAQEQQLKALGTEQYLSQQIHGEG
jgi:bacterioferritin